MDNLSMEEVRRMRADMERAIGVQLTNFQQATGLVPTEVNIHTVAHRPVGNRTLLETIITGVSVKIEL